MTDIVRPRRVVVAESRKAEPRQTDWWRACSDEEFRAAVRAMPEDDQHELIATMKAAARDIELQLADPDADSRSWAASARFAQRKIAERRTLVGGIMAANAGSRRAARISLAVQRGELVTHAEGELEKGNFAEALRFLIAAMRTWDSLLDMQVKNTPSPKAPATEQKLDRNAVMALLEQALDKAGVK